jgi:DNA-binding response OmpR family regulator
MAMYVFGNYILDVDERRLLRDNEEVRLRGKLFDTLRVLVENAGKLGRGKEPRHMQPQRLQDYGSHIRLTPSDA